MNCGQGVYDWTEEGARVGRPSKCVVGCSTCAHLCQGNAITFPDVDELRELYKKKESGQRSKNNSKKRENSKLKNKLNRTQYFKIGIPSFKPENGLSV
jgi:Fe-S-cluster-containing hydrogenase component 2